MNESVRPRMPATKRLFLTFALLAFVPFASAEQTPKTAESLLKGCEYILILADGKKLNEQEIALAAQTTAYVDGYVDAIAMAQGLNPAFEFASLAEERKLQTYIREIATYIRGNPKVRKGATARVALMLTLQANHPPK